MMEIGSDYVGKGMTQDRNDGQGSSVSALPVWASGPPSGNATQDFRARVQGLGFRLTTP